MKLSIMDKCSLINRSNFKIIFDIIIYMSSSISPLLKSCMFYTFNFVAVILLVINSSRKIGTLFWQRECPCPIHEITIIFIIFIKNF